MNRTRRRKAKARRRARRQRVPHLTFVASFYDALVAETTLTPSTVEALFPPMNRHDGSISRIEADLFRPKRP